MNSLKYQRIIMKTTPIVTGELIPDEEQLEGKLIM